MYCLILNVCRCCNTFKLLGPLLQLLDATVYGWQLAQELVKSRVEVTAPREGFVLVNSTVTNTESLDDSWAMFLRRSSRLSVLGANGVLARSNLVQTSAAFLLGSVFWDIWVA